MGGVTLVPTGGDTTLDTVVSNTKDEVSDDAELSLRVAVPE